MAITPDGAFVYVPNYHSGTVSVIDSSDNHVVDTWSRRGSDVAKAFSTFRISPIFSGPLKVDGVHWRASFDKRDVDGPDRTTGGARGVRIRTLRLLTAVEE